MDINKDNIINIKYFCYNYNIQLNLNDILK